MVLWEKESYGLKVVEFFKAIGQQVIPELSLHGGRA